MLESVNKWIYILCICPGLMLLIFQCLGLFDDYDVDDSQGFRISLSFVLNFLMAFGIGGVLTDNVVFALISGAIGGLFVTYCVKQIYVFCKSNEETVLSPSINDECIALTDISPAVFGSVNVMKQTSTGIKIIECYALSVENITCGDVCYIADIDTKTKVLIVGKKQSNHKEG